MRKLFLIAAAALLAIPAFATDVDVTLTSPQASTLTVGSGPIALVLTSSATTDTKSVAVSLSSNYAATITAGGSISCGGCTTHFGFDTTDWTKTATAAATTAPASSLYAWSGNLYANISTENLENVVPHSGTSIGTLNVTITG